MGKKILTKCDRLMYLSLIAAFLKDLEKQRDVARIILNLELKSATKVQIRCTQKRTKKLFTKLYSAGAKLTESTCVNFSIAVCDILISGSTGFKNISAYNDIKESIEKVMINLSEDDDSQALLKCI